MAPLSYSGMSGSILVPPDGMVKLKDKRFAVIEQVIPGNKCRDKYETNYAGEIRKILYSPLVTPTATCHGCTYRATAVDYRGGGVVCYGVHVFFRRLGSAATSSDTKREGSSVSMATCERVKSFSRDK